MVTISGLWHESLRLRLVGRCQLLRYLIPQLYFVCNHLMKLRASDLNKGWFHLEYFSSSVSVDIHIATILFLMNQTIDSKARIIDIPLLTMSYEQNIVLVIK